MDDSKFLAGVDRVFTGDTKPSIESALAACQRASGAPSISRANEAIRLSHLALGEREPRPIFSIGKANAEIAVLRDKLQAAKAKPTIAATPNVTAPTVVTPKADADILAQLAAQGPRERHAFSVANASAISAAHSKLRADAEESRRAPLLATIEKGKALEETMRGLDPSERMAFCDAHKEEISAVLRAEQTLRSIDGH